MDPVQRAAALLARATDPAASEEEARTCAVTAARLMRKHGLCLVAMNAQGTPGDPVRIVTPERVDRWTEIAEDIVELAADFWLRVRPPAPRRRRRVIPPR